MLDIREVIVVEGNHDKARLKQCDQLLDIVTTNGREISTDTLDMLKKLQKTRGLILMLDPDAPGDAIRRQIEAHVGKTKHIFLPKRACIDAQKGKVGIEHASLPVLVAALQHYAQTPREQKETLSVGDLTTLGLSGTPHAAKRRKKVGATLHIGEANTKTFIRRLAMFGITKAMLEKVIE